MATTVIQHLLDTGLADRRTLYQWITQGRVLVDGKVCLDAQAKVEAFEISIEGIPSPLPSKQPKVYFLLNKPKGYVCTHKPGSRRVVDLFSGINLKLMTVGRLDKETTGALLVTNDGAFCQKVAHPSQRIAKEYLVKVNHEVEDHHLKAISQGTMVEGVWVKPYIVRKVRKGTLKVVVYDGRKHEVRLLMGAAGFVTLELKRIRIGGLLLGGLAEGSFKELSWDELQSIFDSKKPQEPLHRQGHRVQEQKKP